MPALGHNAYAALAQESTWGTKVIAGMDFVEFLSEALQKTISEKVQQGINNSRVRTKRSTGAVTVGGTLPFEVNAEDVTGLLLKHTLPTEAFTDLTVGLFLAGRHVFTPGSTLPAGLTAQIGKDLVIHDYFGGRVVSIGFEAALDEFLKATPTLSFKDVEAGIAQSPVYSTEPALIFHKGTFTVDGSSVPISAFSASIATGLKPERRQLGSALIQQQQPGMYDVSGSFTAYFNDMTLVNKFLAQTAGNIVLDFLGTAITGTPETRQLKMEFPTAYLNGQIPSVPGADAEITLTIPFRAIKEGSTELVKLTLLNSRNTAY
jgi:hypothetical protein